MDLIDLYAIAFLYLAALSGAAALAPIAYRAGCRLLTAYRRHALRRVLRRVAADARRYGSIRHV